MPNPKLETYKNKATGTVYDYTDAAAQAALAGILDGTDIESFEDVETALATKVDKVTGKGLSTNDYDDTEKAKVAGAFPRSEQAELGAKNLLNIESANSFSNAEVENNSIVNTDTDSRAANFWVGIRKGTTPVQTLLTLQTLSAVGEYEFRITIPSNADYDNLYIGHNGANHDMKIGIPFSGYGDYIVSFNATGIDSSTVGGYVLTKVMVRLASDPDNTYADFAMTNKELTEQFGLKNSASLISSSNMTINNCAVAKAGNIRVYTIRATANEEIAANAVLFSGFEDPLYMSLDNNSNAVFSDTSNNLYYLVARSNAGLLSIATKSAIPSGTSIRGTFIYIAA